MERPCEAALVGWLVVGAWASTTSADHRRSGQAFSSYRVCKVEALGLLAQKLLKLWRCIVVGIGVDGILDER
jgi:hypothetical protein